MDFGNNHHAHTLSSRFKFNIQYSPASSVLFWQHLLLAILPTAVNMIGILLFTRWLVILLSLLSSVCVNKFNLGVFGTGLYITLSVSHSLNLSYPSNYEFVCLIAIALGRLVVG